MRTNDDAAFDTKSMQTDHTPALRPGVPVSGTDSCVSCAFAVKDAAATETFVFVDAAMSAVHVADNSNATARTLPVVADGSRAVPVRVTTCVASLATTVALYDETEADEGERETVS